MSQLFPKFSFVLFHISVLLVVSGTLALTAEAQTRELRAVGVAQTGTNDRCGEPIWTLGSVPLGPASHGTFLGKKDNSAGAVDAIPLIPLDCMAPDFSVLAATTFDAAYAAVRSWVPPSDSLRNLSFRSIPVPAGNGVRAPIPLPGSVPPNPLPPTITRPTTPVTMGNWLAASGDLVITCDDTNNTASVSARMSNLVPHGVYTMSANWADPSAVLLEVPFGGLPNVIVADRHGDAEFCREVDFCPFDLAPDASSLYFLSLVFHGDGVTYGAVSSEPFTTRAFVGVESLPFLSTIPGGIVSFDHLGFRINATGGPNPGPDAPAGMCNGVVPSILEVDIDIKPGSDPNSINMGSAGVIPVAILGSDTFDATTVDPATVSLAGASVKLTGKSDKQSCQPDDVNLDGASDLVCKVYTEQFMVDEGETTAVLEAETYDGTKLRGEDFIRIVPDS